MKDKYLSGTKLIARYVLNVFPKVDSELKIWRSVCQNAKDDLLAKQALESIRHKKFHAQGGSVYALYPKVNLPDAVKFIVSFQTISDYLDNLCDRSGVFNEASFRKLHLAMTDAIDPEAQIHDYYIMYPFKKDNGYLRSLVEECRSQILKLPSYHLVKNAIKKYVELYTDLQSLKHLQKEVREQKLTNWSKNYISQYKDITQWEFCAATGSTLGIFVLYAAASDPNLTKEEVGSIESAYFPWVCGLHILLDYFIDMSEDKEMGDLNFVHYYENLKHCEERLSLFIQRSFECCSVLRYPEFHMTVIKGLLSMYLSDPKAFLGLNRLAAKNLTKAGGKKTSMYHNMCRVLRFTGML